MEKSPQPSPQSLVVRGVGGALTSGSGLSGSDHPDLSQSDREISTLDRPVLRARKLPRYSPEFLAFWAKYPNKRGKLAASIAWEKRRPELAVVLTALAWQVDSAAWLKDDGAYVPHASTYVNGARWEDEPDGPRRPPPLPTVPCGFHARAVNRNRPAPKSEWRANCPECKHAGLLTKPRVASDPTAIGDLLTSINGGKP